MELKSVSGFTFYVSDLAASTKFYEQLGFRAGTSDAGNHRVYLNWFSITLVDEAQAGLAAEADEHSRGYGIFINIKVADVDETYREALTAGFEPSGKPHNRPWGNREFMLRDPDGYQLVFFSNAKKQLEN